MARDDVRFAMMEGSKLDEEAATRLEQGLLDHPDDLDARLAVVGYLAHPRNRNVSRARLSEHIVWLVSHAPSSSIVGSPIVTANSDDEDLLRRLNSAWTTHLDKPDVDPQALFNAARFFTTTDPGKSRAFLERGEALHPQWGCWSRELGHHIMRMVTVSREIAAKGSAPAFPILDATSRQRDGAIALVHFERSLALCKNDGERFSELSDAAEAAVECGNDEKATTFAGEILRLAPSNSNNRHWRDYVHDAHIVFGRVALRKNDIPSAIANLLDAGRIGSREAPVLQSFGPDFVLARELLDLGETAAILAYLDECERFWKPARIKRWREALAKGEKPHLHRGFDPTECG